MGDDTPEVAGPRAQGLGAFAWRERWGPLEGFEERSDVIFQLFILENFRPTV